MMQTNNKISVLPLVTESAIRKIKNILQNENSNSFVRIYVESGGCSGLSYKFSVDSKTDFNDDITLYEYRNKNILVTDKVSLDFIKNSKIDWQESLTGSQFYIDNPIAKSSCGCGSSFSI